MDTRYDRIVLKISFIYSLFFALTGLTWGHIIGSELVVFDGIYSSVYILVSAIGIYTAKTMSLRDEGTYPYGKYYMEPLQVILSSLVIIVVCLISFSDSSMTFFSGGREINNLSAGIYAMIATIFCFAGWCYLVFTAKKKAPLSSIIKIESVVFGMDTLLSFSVFLGFFCAYMMRYSSEYKKFSQYIDSLMVMVIVLILVWFPVSSLIKSVKELLVMTPIGDIYNTSREILERISAKHGFKDFVLYVGKGGRSLNYSIFLVAEDSKKTISFGKMDAIQKEIKEELIASFNNPVWLNVSFTNNMNSFR